MAHYHPRWAGPPADPPGPLDPGAWIFIGNRFRAFGWTADPYCTVLYSTCTTSTVLVLDERSRPPDIFPIEMEEAAASQAADDETSTPSPPSQELAGPSAAFLDFVDVELGPCAVSLAVACRDAPKTPNRAMTRDKRERAAEARAHHLAIACELQRLERERAARCRAVAAGLREADSSAACEPLADYTRFCDRLLDTVGRATAQQPMPTDLEAPCIAYTAAIKAHRMMGERLRASAADEKAKQTADSAKREISEEIGAADGKDEGTLCSCSSGRSTPRHVRRPSPLVVPKLLINPPWDSSSGARRSPPRRTWAEMYAERLKYGDPCLPPRPRSAFASPRSARSNATSARSSAAPSSNSSTHRAQHRRGRRPISADRRVELRRADLHCHIDYLAPNGAPDNDRRMGTGGGTLTSQAFVESLRNYPTRTENMSAAAAAATSAGGGSKGIDGTRTRQRTSGSGGGGSVQETTCDESLVARAQAVHEVPLFSGRTHTARQAKVVGDDWEHLEDDLRRRRGVPLTLDTWQSSQLQPAWGEERSSLAKHMDKYRMRLQEQLL